MNIENRRLTELDLKYITKVIGRDPSDIELDLIENVLNFELENRDYLEILTRLNRGANRIENSKITLKNDNKLKIINGLQIYKNGKEILKRDESNTEVIINNLNPIISGYTLNGNNSDTNFIKKRIDYNSKLVLINHKPTNYSADEIIFSSIVCTYNSKNIDNNINLTNSKVYRIEVGKRFKKNLKKLELLINTAKSEDWFITLNNIDYRGIGYSLIHLLNKINYGINIPNNKVTNINKSLNDKYSFLAVPNNKIINNLESFCKNFDIELEEIGDLTKDSSIQIYNNKEIEINFSLQVFDLQYDINTKHFDEPNIQPVQSAEIIKGIKKSSLTNQFIKLFEKIISNSTDLVKSKNGLKREISVYGVQNPLENGIGQLVLTHSDNNNLLEDAPRLSGKMTIANATRKIACSGAKPKSVIVHNLFPKNSSKSIWHASEILQGQEEAIRDLELTIGNRNIDAFGDYFQQNVLAIGEIQISQNANIGFKNDGDFISLLGSHRGELGGSEFQKYISENTSNAYPTVDLNMERRLQDVVHQGINTSLIKTATNVGMGGISIAIAMSLVTSNAGIGARIHLSRKLTNEELLFGETQGLVVVTLFEEDIMEFERICMTVGVPSTTIGRVTNDGIYTFNELINLKVEKIRKLIN